MLTTPDERFRGTELQPMLYNALMLSNDGHHRHADVHTTLVMQDAACHLYSFICNASKILICTVKLLVLSPIKVSKRFMD